MVDSAARRASLRGAITSLLTNMSGTPPQASASDTGMGAPSRVTPLSTRRITSSRAKPRAVSTGMHSTPLIQRERTAGK